MGRLDHGRVQLDRGRAAGRRHHRRPPRGQTEAQGHEPRRPLVEDDVHPEPVARRGRGRSAWSATRAPPPRRSPRPGPTRQPARRRRRPGRPRRDRGPLMPGSGRAARGSMGWTGDPVVLVHGFTQSAQSWGPFGTGAGTPPRRHRPRRAGARGVRGRRRRSAGRRRSDGQAAGGEGAWIGYSMGGRYALHVALRHPQAVTPAGSRQRHGRHRRSRRAAPPAGKRTRCWPTGSRRTAWNLRANGGCSDRCSHPAAAGGRRREPPRRAPPPAWRPACGWPAPAPRSPCGPACNQLEMPVLVVVGERDATYFAHGHRLVRQHRGQRRPGGGRRTPATPAIWSGPTPSWAPSCHSWTAVITRSRFRPPAGRRRPAAAAPWPPARRSVPCPAPRPAPGGPVVRQAAGPARASSAPEPGRPRWRRPPRTGISTAATYSRLVAGAPMRTARVRLPLAVSPGMSRRLLTTSRATASRPTGTAAATARPVIRPIWT